MSTQPSIESRPMPTGKQPNSIYTVMLILAMVFMAIAVLAMYIELSRWAPDYWDTRAAQPQAAIAVTNPYA